MPVFDQTIHRSDTRSLPVMEPSATHDAGTGLSSASILLIDDDVELCDLVEEFLRRRRITVECVHDGRRGLARALAGEHDLVLLDVMMPGIDGFELLRLVRRQSQIPVIMLTARTSQIDRIAGLDAGADDYLPKPFGPEELLARIRAVLRRAGRLGGASDTIEVNGVTLIPAAREVKCHGTTVAVTSIEFDILELLLRGAGRTISRDELTAAVYHRRASPFDRALDMHVSHLRKKLGSQGRLIRTVRGIGYLFCADSGNERSVLR